MSTYSTQKFPAYPSEGEPFEELEIVAQEDAGWSYDWDEFVVLRKPGERLYYIAEGSGCSCDYLWSDYGQVTDLDGPLSFHEVATRAEQWEAEEYREGRRGRGTRIVEELLKAER